MYFNTKEEYKKPEIVVIDLELEGVFCKSGDPQLTSDDDDSTATYFN